MIFDFHIPFGGKLRSDNIVQVHEIYRHLVTVTCHVGCDDYCLKYIIHQTPIIWQHKQIQ